MPLLLIVALAVVAGCSASPVRDDTVTVFAAASLKNALDEVAARVLRPAGLSIRLTYAGTPALARQIAAGAPADLFIAADEAWMDDVARGGHVQAATRVALLGNALVLIAPADTARPVALSSQTALRALLGDGRLAVADPESVPAGRYAREALTTLGLWAQVADRLAPNDNVRAALALVARGEAPLGVVYQSDARDEPRVAIVAAFADTTHTPIRYPVALTTRSRPDGAVVVQHLRSRAAAAIFVRHGFTALAEAP